MPSSPHRPALQPEDRPCILLALGWYASAIHKGISRYARQADWILDQTMTRHGLVPTSWGGNGIISVLHVDSELFKLVKNAKVPVVNIGSVTLEGNATVSPDDALLGKTAAEYFAERGFKHYAFFLRTNSPSSKIRCEAFQRSVQKMGHKCQVIDWPSYSKMPAVSRYTRSYPAKAYDERALITWLGKELAKLPKPIALLAEHDEVAIDVLHACRSQGIAVPEQIAVLGIDDDALRCEFAPVPLSSIDCGQELLGYEAAALLDKLLKGIPVPETPLLIPPQGITTRMSTDILAIDHPHVARALRHIWQHYTERINAKTVAATVPISYRRLHDAFLQSVGKTIADEIEHKRLEHAKRLLIETKKKAFEIAQLSGFPDNDRLGRVFTRVVGMTPLAYRRKFGKGNHNPPKKPDR